MYRLIVISLFLVTYSIAETPFSAFLSNALKHSPSLKSFEQKSQSESDNFKISQGKFFPKIDLNTTLALDSRDVVDSINNVDEKSIDLSLSQVVLDVRSFRELAVKKKNIKLSKLKFLKKKQDVLLDAVRQYLSWWSNNRRLIYAIKYYDLMFEQKKNIRSRYEAGELTLTDVYQTEAEVKEAELRLRSVRSDLAMALNELQKRNWNKINGLGSLPKRTNDSFFATNVLEQGNLEILIAQEEVLIKELEDRVQSSAYWPQLSLDASVERVWDSEYARAFPWTDARVGINANFNVFRGFQDQNTSARQNKLIREKMFALEKMKLDQAVQKDNLNKEIKTLILDLKDVREVIEMRSKILIAMKIEFEAGTRTLSDFLLVQSQIFDDQERLVYSQRELFLKEFQMMLLLGMVNYGKYY